MRETLIIVFLFLLPMLSLSEELSAADLMELCDGKDNYCKNFAKAIQETMSPSLIMGICKSSHSNAERTCYYIIERALEIGAELPVDYLKKECFGSSLKKQTVCLEIRHLCDKFPKSDSCSKLLQNQTFSMAPEMMLNCHISSNACRVSAQFLAKDAKIRDFEEICEIDDSARELACRHLIRETIRIAGELKVQDWKNKCRDKSDIFCNEIVSACDEADKSGNKAFCDELAKARDEIKNGDLMSTTMKLVIIVSAVGFTVLVVNGGMFVFRKKIFKSYYNNKIADQGKPKKKKNGKGSVANSESESVQQQPSRKESDVLTPN